MPANRTALVTGAAGGLGRGVVQRLAQEGYRVAALDLKESDITTVSNSSVVPYTCDVTDSNQVEEVVADILDRWERIDCLISGAGVLGPLNLADTSVDAWDTTMAVNLKASFILARHVVPVMKHREWGRIVLIGSVNGKNPGSYLIPYRVSKAALLMFGHCLALETARFGITVNVVSPGVVDTELQHEVYRVKTQQQPDPAPYAEFLSTRAATIPIGRLATVEDIAEAVLFFLSESAGALSGQNLFVDGGEFQVI